MSGFSYLHEDVKDEIKKVVRRIITECSIIEPPVDTNILYESEDLVSETFCKDDPAFIHLVQDIGAENADTFRGILFVNKNLVLARDDGYDRRIRFIYGHEFGHWKLPWHRQILYKCTQFDLSPQARKQMEREANFFAGQLLFMGDNFIENVHYCDLSVQFFKGLADKYLMSKESTMRWAVELEHRPCALLIMEVNVNDPDNFLRVKYSVESAPFKNKYGFSFGQGIVFPKGGKLAKIITDPLKKLLNFHQCQIRCKTPIGEIAVFEAESWFNGYNVCTLLKPSD